MANKKNKVKFGLQNVYWAKINEWVKTRTATRPFLHMESQSICRVPYRFIDANGEAENFHADNGVYYVINNNAGYTGDLEIALITTEFATEILGEILDNNGVLVERNDTELAQFALMFEFLGDKHHIRHVMYCCSASRPTTESATTEESTEVKTEKLSLKATFAHRSCKVQDNRKHVRYSLQQLVQDAVQPEYKNIHNYYNHYDFIRRYIYVYQKNITIDGMEVPFKASAAVPRLYRLKFRRDIYKDFASLKTDVEEGDENKSELDIESLEVFENIAYIMAKHADPESVPDSPDDFLEQFNTFSIYEILPQLIELWG